MRNKLLTVVGAALLAGLLALGMVTVAGPPVPPGPPGPPPKPEPPPQITPDQIIDGVNQLIPHVSIVPLPPELIDRVGPKLPPELATTPKNRLPGTVAVPPGVRLFAARSLDDGVFLGKGGGTVLGAIELDRDYKLGSEPLKKGFYPMAALSDPENELDKATDPQNKIDFYLVIVRSTDLGGGQVKLEIAGLIGLPQKELARVMGMVDPVLQIEFAQAVLLNLTAALLQ